MKNSGAVFVFAAVSLLLAGCGGEQHQELRAWMREQESGIKRKIDPLPKVVPYEAVIYDVGGALDPFNTLRAKVTGDARGASLPDDSRPREPLEEFPLETIKLVGILQDKTRLVAQVIANGRGYQVKVGNYVGQNFGRVVKIETRKNEEGVVVKELVKDADDRWVERESTLLLDTRGAQ